VSEKNLQRCTERDNLESGERNGTLEISKNEENTKLVPITCAICLASYQTGETVVWSSNSACCHVFHEDCISKYLETIKGAGYPCPCCRQRFCDMSSLNPQKKQQPDTTRNREDFEADETRSQYNYVDL
jgi:hypothetical protein